MVRLARCEVIDPGEVVLRPLPGSWWSCGDFGIPWVAATHGYHL